MNVKFTYLTFLFLFSIFITNAQDIPKDSLYGDVKRIRSKVIFLTKKENHQLLYYNDYGHSGFMGPEPTIARFYNIWFSTEQSYFLNYERLFNKNRRIVKENWYGKKDDFLRSYRNVYNEKDTLTTEIDSTEYSISTTRHYYDYDCENIIFTNPDYDFFSHQFLQYKNGRVIRSKKYNERGIVNEYIYKYNDEGKLKFRIYKNPNSWRKVDEKSWGYGPQDSIGHIYKDLVNEYDMQNRITSTKRYDLYSDPNRANPILKGETTYTYDGDNIISVITNTTTRTYKYDQKNRLIESYCCDKDISKAKMIQKYRYKKGKVSELIYIEEDWVSKQIKQYKISFKYKFDDHNNWVEIIKNVNGIDLYKWIREIEYY